MRILLVVAMVFTVSVSLVQAQTDTPVPTDTPTPSETPTETNTPTSEPFVHMTMPPDTGTPEGQMTRFDYTSTAGDVQIANLLTLLVYSLWGMFFFGIVGLIILVRRK